DAAHGLLFARGVEPRVVIRPESMKYDGDAFHGWAGSAGTGEVWLTSNGENGLWRASFCLRTRAKINPGNRKMPMWTQGETNHCVWCVIEWSEGTMISM